MVGPNRTWTVWPSGLRRWLQAPVRKGVGSKPTAVISERATFLFDFAGKGCTLAGAATKKLINKTRRCDNANFEDALLSASPGEMNPLVEPRRSPPGRTIFADRS